MVASPERLDAYFVLLQAVIARQAANSFVVKGWALTASLALYGFAINNESEGLAWLGGFATLIFWVLDAYFLRQERLFRCLYNAAIAEDGSVQLYSMDTTRFKGTIPTQLWSCATSWSLVLFYGTIGVTALVLGSALNLA